LVDQDRQHLFDEQRISFGRLHDPGTNRLVQSGPLQEICDQVLALGSIERLQQDRRGVELAPAPPGPPIQQLGTGDAQTAPSRQLGIKMSYQGSNGIFLLLWCHGNDNGC